MQRYGRFDAEFRGRVVARMKYEGLGPYEMATVLEQEATEDYARRLRIAKKRIGDRAFVDAPVRTPRGQTIERWARGDDSAVRRLRRMMDRIGPVTKHMFAEALELLGWEDGTAAMKLGATPELIRRWRNDADPPSYIAAHARTLIDVLDGRQPRLGPRAKAVGSTGRGIAPREAPEWPRTRVVFRSR